MSKEERKVVNPDFRDKKPVRTEIIGLTPEILAKLKRGGKKVDPNLLKPKSDATKKSEYLNFLKEHPNEIFTVKDVSEKFNVNTATIAGYFKELAEKGVILRSTGPFGEKNKRVLVYSYIE